jgi:Aspartyl protease
MLNRRSLALSSLLFFSASKILGQAAVPVNLNIFASAKNTATFPFEWREGMIFIPVSISGSQTLHFVLDTGSTRILIDKSIANSLGLKGAESGSLQGAGTGRIATEALHHIDLDFPDLQSKDYECVTADLAPLEQTLKTKVDGILGYEVFSRFVITVDFKAKQLTVTLPSAFLAPEGAEELPIAIHDKWAFVKGTLVLPGPVAVSDSFLIDSGSSDAVDHPIVKTMQSRTTSKSGIGLGAPTDGAIARADSFRIGTFTVKKPILSCCGATEDRSRLIGTEVLRHFLVTFDYPGARLFLAPQNGWPESAMVRS